MNHEWSPRARLGYVATCLVLFTAIMTAYAKFVVNPLEDWVRTVAADWPPEIGFGFLVLIFPVWFGSIWWMKRRGML